MTLFSEAESVTEETLSSGYSANTFKLRYKQGRGRYSGHNVMRNDGVQFCWKLRSSGAWRKRKRERHVLISAHNVGQGNELWRSQTQ